MLLEAQILHLFKHAAAECSTHIAFCLSNRDRGVVGSTRASIGRPNSLLCLLKRLLLPLLASALQLNRGLDHVFVELVQGNDRGKSLESPRTSGRATGPVPRDHCLTTS